MTDRGLEGDGPDTTGPTLYLEGEDLRPAEAFCSKTFENAANGEYRVVQLSSSQSFESLSEGLATQLQDIADPSEAAVIITRPRTDDEDLQSEVGEHTRLYGYRVDPQDLTGISIAFSRLLDNWSSDGGSVNICLRDVESLFPYHDTDLIYRFLNTVLATLQGAGASVHMHLRTSATDEATVQMFQSLFTRVVDPEDSPLEATAADARDTATADDESEPAPGAGASDAGDAQAEGSPSEAGQPTVTMSDDEIDAFLTANGLGVMAFAGEPPYAIPMSYGYDPDDRVAYIQLGTFEGSEKRARLEDSMAVSLVVSQYERPDRWRSVIVDGTLSRLSREEAQRADVLEAYAESDLASVDVFSRNPADVDFEWYVLEPDAISGRQGPGSK